MLSAFIHPGDTYAWMNLTIIGSDNYDDHKLPSVATHDLEHAGHDSYLAL